MRSENIPGGIVHCDSKLRHLKLGVVSFREVENVRIGERAERELNDSTSAIRGGYE
jgi:hypothetical protein